MALLRRCHACGGCPSDLGLASEAGGNLGGLSPCPLGSVLTPRVRCHRAQLVVGVENTTTRPHFSPSRQFVDSFCYLQLNRSVRFNWLHCLVI